MTLITVTVEEYKNRPASSADTYRIVDKESELLALDFGKLQSSGVVELDATDGALKLEYNQFTLLGNIKIGLDDILTLRDRTSTLKSLMEDQLKKLADAGFDVLDAHDSTKENPLVLMRSQVDALGTMTFAANNTVIMGEMKEALEKLSASDLAALAAKNIDRIDVGANPIPVLWTAEQLVAMGSMGFRQGDTVVLSDTSTNIAKLSPAAIASMAGKEIKSIDAQDNALLLSVSQFNALGTVSLRDANDVVTLFDSGSLLGGLTVGQLTALGARGNAALDARDDVLGLSLAQFNALGAVKLNAADAVSLSDTGAVLGALTSGQMAALAAKGVDGIDAKDNALTMTVAQFEALGSLSLAADDVVTLLANRDYALGANVANLVLTDNAISGTGNGLSNTITGTFAANVLSGLDGNDVLDGGGGADLMAGGAGLDTYIVDNVRDRVVETSAGGAGDQVFSSVSHTLANHVEKLFALGSGSISLSGNSAGNTIVGGAGKNKIDGGYGKDVLTGGKGRDTFIFNDKLSKTKNLDKITDFSVKDDTVWLDNKVFKEIGKGSVSKPKKLDSDYFTIGAKAKDADDYIIYNKNTGYLYYDKDGSGDAGAVAFAQLKKGLNLKFDDFYVV
jgi:Ca2+-binding RTX toxin-like protein